MSTSNMISGAYGVNAVFSAYSAYEAGKMQQVAYNHQAAMNEINAKQIEIETTFIMADKMDELTKTLSMQNVIAAATGRAGGSISNITQTSNANLEKEETRLIQQGQSQKLALLSGAEANRMSGSAAKTSGFISGASQLLQGATKAYGYIE